MPIGYVQIVDLKYYLDRKANPFIDSNEEFAVVKPCEHNGRKAERLFPRIVSVWWI